MPVPATKLRGGLSRRTFIKTIVLLPMVAARVRNVFASGTTSAQVRVYGSGAYGSGPFGDYELYLAFVQKQEGPYGTSTRTRR